MPRTNSAKNFIIALLAIAIVVVLVIWWQFNISRRINLENSLSQTILTQPVKLSPFQLIDSNGPTFTNQSLQGRWAFIYFGYTDCGEVCDKSMAALSQVYDQLKAQSQFVPLIIFVSVKSHQDTLSKIQQYITRFNPNFLGLTADINTLKPLTHELGVQYVKLKSPGIGKDIDGEQLAHTGTVFLIDPAGKLHAIFSMPYTVADIISAYKTMVNPTAKPPVLTKNT